MVRPAISSKGSWRAEPRQELTVRLAEKLAHLRQVEGQIRGFDRPLTKAEVVRAMRSDIGAVMSHAYLSQLESGARAHLSGRSRDLLARFYKVHPGYLVDDPPDYQTEILSASLLEQDPLRSWLANRAEEQRNTPPLYRLLVRLSRVDDPRHYLGLLDDLLDLPPDELRRIADSATSARDRNANSIKEAAKIPTGNKEVWRQ
jgi:transcriptional regulator with XRE-family HTH domain